MLCRIDRNGAVLDEVNIILWTYGEHKTKPRCDPRPLAAVIMSLQVVLAGTVTRLRDLRKI